MEVTNRFKGLDLIDRVPKELWTEVCHIVIQTIPKKKKLKKAKWLSEEALQIDEKRKEATSLCLLTPNCLRKPIMAKLS